ncbi:MAG: SDR family oxidoreductase [Sedimentisphaerales bacterium]|nr:SDR family oxidoreductase [Sedimentisphaerales bacterium]
MEEKFDLTGKVAVVTGAGGVLCSEMARALAAAGAKVAVLDLMEDAAKRVADEINEGGIQNAEDRRQKAEEERRDTPDRRQALEDWREGAEDRRESIDDRRRIAEDRRQTTEDKALAVKCSVLDKKQLEEARETIIGRLGRVDILINGAGGNKKEATTSDSLTFFDLPMDAIRGVLDLNIIGTILPSQVFGKAMAEQKQGVILNISSMNAFRPLTKICGYSAAKAAVSNFTQWLAVHICQNYSKDIRVNAIAPGFFLTEQNRFLLTDEKTGQLTPRGKTIIEHTPMGRFGQPNDLTGTMLWLVSDAAKFVTGIVVPVDGGFSAFSGV